ncbi:MAG: bck1-like resistance to osmotic shock [Thelocarpon impressellum]|nr:MAG: bck1-like resistance to osmotic shock [Thelocarpon impressellum]
MTATQAPMLSSPLKQTNEIDWIAPLKAYIRETYGDDPERYAEECATLNRLRQDMRGAGKDSAAGRDLLYRYYGQLELLDLRFPVDENHIKIAFTWFDAFTHKPTAQYSLAYEKASIIFNISAVLSCHAAHQNRSEDTGLKTAYHSFQASAGMFTYINENFLHAPSTDLSRDTVKTLIGVMLAQGQEVFLEKQVADDKKVGLLAKLASQAAFLYAQAAEGVQDNVNRAVFEKVWAAFTQIKASHTAALAQYYQAVADNDANAHGVAIARLTVADGLARDASRAAAALPASMPAHANLGADAAAQMADMTRRLLANVQDRLREFVKDNDFIYHQPVPGEAALAAIPKLPAAKAIPVSELYAGQDIQRIIGPDIFQRIVPMAVTESASLYDEEKAKLVRAETERVDLADGEMAASLDYLKLPGSLGLLKGGLDRDGATADAKFGAWCEDVASRDRFAAVFERMKADKAEVAGSLERGARQLDMEESVCEKMRSKYGADWTQQPSSRLTTTLRGDLRSYREAVVEAAGSDARLLATFAQHESDIDEMRSAGETDEADVLFRQAMVKAGAGRGRARSGVSSPAEASLLDEDYGEGGVSVPDQIARVEDLLKKLGQVKRERGQVLKDLKEKVHTDDISNVLILNKKSISNHESQLFKAELEKFRPYHDRLLQANHKQASLLKELTNAYGDLLQDRRVRAEQGRYESLTRQRNAVMTRYRKVWQVVSDLGEGLAKAQDFYTEMKDSVESLERNVETFVNNRRSEGAQLLSQIERSRGNGGNGGGGGGGGQADRERERLKELMERMSMDPSAGPPMSPPPSGRYVPQAQPQAQAGQAQYGQNGGQQPPRRESYNSSGAHVAAAAPGQQQHDPYNPGAFARRDSYQTTPVSPPAQQQHFSPLQAANYVYPAQQPQAQQQGQQYMPPGYVPPPPPPGPPPLGPQQTYPIQPNAAANGRGSTQQPNANQRGPNAPPGGAGNDPWGGLSAWK